MRQARAAFLGGEIQLRDGRRVTLRPVEHADAAAILAFLDHLSEEDRRLRFFTGAANMRGNARWAADADGIEHCGLLAIDRRGRVVGHAMYVRVDASRAEVAVEVADDFHHLGLATMLVARLARDAAGRGVDRFIAEVLPENRDMLAVFADGFASVRTFADGEVHVEFDTASWELSQERFGDGALLEGAA